MSASSRAKVLLQRCGSVGESTTSPPFQRSLLRRLPLVETIGGLAGRRARLSRPQPPVGGSLMRARYSSSSGSPVAPEAGGSSDGGDTAAAPRFAFAFDVDGVLVHSSKPIPGAASSLRFLQKYKIPFVLLTNGGGKPEEERVAELSSILGVQLDASNLVQSHTPFHLLAASDEKPLEPKPPRAVSDDSKLKVIHDTGLWTVIRRHHQLDTLRHATVLVLGSDASKAREIAHGYGFESVVTPGDILKACPEIFPFNPLHEFYDKQTILPLPKPIYNPRDPRHKLEDCLKITAIMVFNDPRDWAVDLQLIIDLMFSYRGYLGTSGRELWGPETRGQGHNRLDSQPILIFSNNDLVWSTGYHLPRFGQGTFRSAVKTFYRAAKTRLTTSEETRPPKFKCHDFGKPHLPAYTYAELALEEYNRKLWRRGQREGQHDRGDDLEKYRIDDIYMVGDNMDSDIRGVINRNLSHAARPYTKEHVLHGFPHPIHWKGCLVKTGVWNEEDLPLEKLEPSRRPHVVQDNVMGAVNWALKQQGWPGRVKWE